MDARLCAAVICTGIATATAVLNPASASADVNFVRCNFSVAKPYIYSLNGQDYVASRIDATGCTTNLGSTPMNLEMDVNISNQQPDGTWKAHTNSYVATHDVHDGDSFSVVFPNDDRLIPLLPGGYTASGTATSSVPGYSDPRHIASELFAWGVPYIPT